MRPCYTVASPGLAKRREEKILLLCSVRLKGGVMVQRESNFLFNIILSKTSFLQAYLTLTN